jgi:hypothetical protein
MKFNLKLLIRNEAILRRFADVDGM